MLVLVFCIGARRYGLAAADVLEVVPWVPLQPASNAPAWIAGLLQHRAGTAPVIDVTRLVADRPSSPLLSTRIVVLRRDAAAGALIGLLVENVTEAVRIDAAEPGPIDAVDANGGRAGRAPQPVDSLQLVRWTDLVPPELRGALAAAGAPA